MTTTVQDKKVSKPLQLSETAIREKLRHHAPEAIEILVNIMRNGDNDNARMGAAKVVLSKVVPDLKSTEFNGEGAKALAGLLNIFAERRASQPVAE